MSPFPDTPSAPPSTSTTMGEQRTLLNVSSLLLLLFFIYAVMGVQMFAKVTLENTMAADEHANFQVRLDCVRPVFICADLFHMHIHLYNIQYTTHNIPQTFGTAMLTLLRCATGEYWNGLMYDFAVQDGICKDDIQYDPHMCGFSDSPTCIPLDGIVHIHAMQQRPYTCMYSRLEL